MDIGILFNLATDDACIYRKQNPQRVRLKDLSALWTCSPGYREPLVLWPQGGVFVLPCPFHKADFNRPDSCNVFLERFPLLFRMACGFMLPSLYARFSTSCSIPVFRSPIRRSPTTGRM